MDTQRETLLIVLNGASSAGKTTIAHALLAQVGDSIVFTSFDQLLAKIRPFGADRRGIIGRVERTLRITRFQMTDGRLHLFYRLHREVADLVRTGTPVILETSLMDPRALYDAALCFAPLNGLFVGVKPPLAVSEQWEAARGDRPIGQARKHYHLIHAHETYDLILDPSSMTPAQCAAAILHRWNSTPAAAFENLRT